MTNRSTTAMSLSEFEHLLEVYGADRTRWPIAARASAAACLASSASARKLHSEAGALDAVLLLSEEPDKKDVTALIERIVAASQTTPRLTAPASEMTDVSRRPAGRVVTPKSKIVAGKVVAGRDWMRGVAVLAASLVIGIFVGQSQLGARAVPALEDLTGISAAQSADRLAMLDLHLEAVDED